MNKQYNKCKNCGGIIPICQELCRSCERDMISLNLNKELNEPLENGRT